MTVGWSWLFSAVKRSSSPWLTFCWKKVWDEIHYSLSDFNLHWTKTKHIAFFFTLFEGYKCDKFYEITPKKRFLWEAKKTNFKCFKFHKIKSFAWWFYPSAFSQFLWNLKFIFLRSHLASIDQEKLNWNKFKITGKQCKKTLIDIISMEFLLLGWRFFSLQDVLVARSQERPLYSQTTNLKTYNWRQDELRHFTLNWAICMLYWLQKEEIQLLLPYPLHAMLCRCLNYLQKTTNTQTLNGGAVEGSGFFCSLKLPNLSTMSQQ